VWRIGLADRRRGEPQRIALSVLLPVTQQAWFWLLIAVAAGSLLFAAWRYMSGLRLQREHALAQERSRIAQDLHDSLGADLTQMALLGELALRNLDRPGSARRHLEKLFASAHGAARQLDTVVWAVNPAHDTVESVVQHLCKFAQEFLALAGVRCRLAVPEELPQVALSSPVRHDLFLAVKEALHNVVRHAAATLVTLRILIRGRELVVEVEDNGKGLSGGTHLPEQDGLDNIQARMAKVGGCSECVSGPGGKGTRVRMRMPIGRTA
jgi:signal transduction histidine kinase